LGGGTGGKTIFDPGSEPFNDPDLAGIGGGSDGDRRCPRNPCIKPGSDGLRTCDEFNELEPPTGGGGAGAFLRAALA